MGMIATISAWASRPHTVGHYRPTSTTVRRRVTRIGMLLVVGALYPALAQAQESSSTSLRTATIAASAAAAADWASTYHALKYYRVRETNPLLRPLDSAPGKMVAVGALMDFGGVVVWNRAVGRKHPKLATTGLWVMTAFRTYLAVNNMRNERIASRR